MNIPTIIISILIAAAFAFSIRSIVKNRKSSGCNGGCGGCPYSNSCMKAPEVPEEIRKTEALR